jgi:hypothetical protein
VNSESDQTRALSVTTEGAIRLVLVMSGLIGAFGRAFAPIKEKDAAWPVLDATTIAWLALILVAYLVPRVSEITLGGASLKLLENVDKATGKYQGTINDFSGLLQNWLESELENTASRRVNESPPTTAGHVVLTQQVLAYGRTRGSALQGGPFWQSQSQGSGECADRVAFMAFSNLERAY